MAVVSWEKSVLRSTLNLIPGLARLYHAFRGPAPSSQPRERFRRGHFYSPLPDLNWVAEHAESLFRKDVKLGTSIDLRLAAQESLLRELAPYDMEFEFPAAKMNGFRYHWDNPMFGRGSAFSLYAMLRRFKPRRVVEVGSGFTSALMLDVNSRHLGGAVAFTFIEPYSERLHSLLTDEDRQCCVIIERPVQEVDTTPFDELQEYDFLFVDSSHVSKIGSDVNHLLFTVLPRLAPGVIVHFHDIYWPFEYPQEWVLDSVAWNEAYLLRAFLQYNDAFQILQFNDLLAHHFADYYRKHLPQVAAEPGSSLWLRKR